MYAGKNQSPSAGAAERPALVKAAKQWSTPGAASPNSLRGNLVQRDRAGHQVNLMDQVAHWATPTQRDWKDTTQSGATYGENGMLGR
jgi:hypothetical protein